jgi:NifB/MoaA-like Fe-S oxidoreductase
MHVCIYIPVHSTEKELRKENKDTKCPKNAKENISKNMHVCIYIHART